MDPMLAAIPQDSVLRAFPLRDETVALIRRQKRFDMLVVGGGLQGTVMAWLAALHGLSVVLLERAHHASGYSSFVPPILDLGVLQGGASLIRQRKRRMQLAADWRTVAPHLVTTQAADSAFAGRGIAASLRSTLSALSWDSRLSAHCNLKRADVPAYTMHRHDLDCVDIERLTRETLIMARQEGAVCLNYAEVRSMQSRRRSVITVTFRDLLGEHDYQLQCGVVCNCAGWGASSLGRITSGQSGREEVWDVRGRVAGSWPSGPLILHEQNGERALVMNLPAGGTGVWIFGARSRPDHLKYQTESAAALNALANRIGLSPPTLIASMPRVSSRTPFEVGYTTMAATYRFSGCNPLQTREGARAVLADVLERAGRSDKVSLPEGRPYPGAAAGEISALFREQAGQAGHAPDVVEAVLSRLGARVRYLTESPQLLLPLGKRMVRGEAVLAIIQEQVATLPDLVRCLGCEDEVQQDPALHAQLSDLCAGMAHDAPMPRAASDLSP